jgi:hypothetical protein
VRFGADGHVAAPEPTSAGRCGPKLQLTWQRVDARPAHCLDLELVCGLPGLQCADTHVCAVVYCTKLQEYLFTIIYTL